MGVGVTTTLGCKEEVEGDGVTETGEVAEVTAVTVEGSVDLSKGRRGNKFSLQRLALLQHSYTLVSVLLPPSQRLGLRLKVTQSVLRSMLPSSSSFLFVKHAPSLSSTVQVHPSQRQSLKRVSSLHSH